MSVIIRLQNLPWSANSYDIRQFFEGLSIPEGGVHIVGGELGDAFIAFSTDEDARQAMRLTGGKIKEIQVHLMLSSRNEMQKVIEAARSMTFPPVQAQPQPQQQQQQQPSPVQQAPQQQSILAQLASNQSQLIPQKSEIVEDKRDRSGRRSRSRDRSGRRSSGRRDSREGSSRRRRSRSRDRERRRKSRSRSRDRNGRDRFGRDVEKKVEDRPRTDVETKPETTRNEVQVSNDINLPELPRNPFGLQQPYMNDRLSAAMQSTLAALNLPQPKANDANDAKFDAVLPSTKGRDPRNGRDGSPAVGNVPNNPFGVSSSGLSGLNSTSISGLNPTGLAGLNTSSISGLNPAGLSGLNSAGLSGINAASLSGFPAGLTELLLQSQLNKPYAAPVKSDPSQVWLTQPTINPALTNLASFPLGLAALNPNLLDELVRQEIPDRKVNQDNDSRRGPFDPRGGQPDQRRSDWFPEQDRRGNFDTERRPDRRGLLDPPQNMERNSRNYEKPQRDDHSFGRSRSPDLRRRPVDIDRRDDFLHRDPRSRRDYINKPRFEEPSRGVCVELRGMPHVHFRDVRRCLRDFGCNVDEIRYNHGPNGKVSGVKFFDEESKRKAVEAGFIPILDGRVQVFHLPDDVFETFRQGRMRQQPEFPPPGGQDEEDEDFRASRFIIRDRDNDNRNGRFNKRNEGPRGGDFPPNRDRDAGNQRDRNRFALDNRSGEKRPPPMELDQKAEVNGDEKREPVAENATPSECIFMSKLPKGTTDRDLCDFFSDIGLTPRHLHIMLNEGGEPSGDAYVEFHSPEQAQLACNKNDAPLGPSNVLVRMSSQRELDEALGGPIEEMQNPPPIKSLLDGPMMPQMAPIMPPMMMPFPPMMGGPRHMRPRFPGPLPPRANTPGDPHCVVTMYNIPYRATTEEILEFFGPSYNLGPMSVFRKLNERNQPTSEARVVMATPKDALRAVDTLSDTTIHDRPIQLGILGASDRF